MNSADRRNFLYPRSRYHGNFTPSRLTFNANLQEFAQQVTYISNLETSGKLSSTEAYEKIQSLWHQVQRSYHTLGLDQS